MNEIEKKDLVGVLVEEKIKQLCHKPKGERNCVEKIIRKDIPVQRHCYRKKDCWKKITRFVNRLEI